MSNLALTWAYEQHALKPHERFTLVTIADRANHDGVAWFSYRDISLRTGYTVRRLQQLVKRLEGLGYVERVERTGERGRQTSNLFILHMERGNNIREVGRSKQRVAEYHASLPRSPRDVGPGHKPVDNPPPECEGEGENFTPPLHDISPLDMSEISPLESRVINPSSVPGPVVRNSRAVDNKKESPSLATGTTSAPDGAQGALDRASHIQRRLNAERPSRAARGVSAPDGAQEVRQVNKEAARIAIRAAKKILGGRDGTT